MVDVEDRYCEYCGKLTPMDLRATKNPKRNKYCSERCRDYMNTCRYDKRKREKEIQRWKQNPEREFQRVCTEVGIELVGVDDIWDENRPQKHNEKNG